MLGRSTHSLNEREVYPITTPYLSSLTCSLLPVGCQLRFDCQGQVQFSLVLHVQAQPSLVLDATYKKPGQGGDEHRDSPAGGLG